jgi:DNA-directed RNA polymerase beta subunit
LKSSSTPTASSFRPNSGQQAQGDWSPGSLQEVFPIQSYDEKVTLDFASYEIGEPKLSIRESMRESQTFSAPLHVTFS